MIMGSFPCAKVKLSKPAILLSILTLVACVDSTDLGPNAPDRGMEQQAAQKVHCAIENQARCAHIIENRTLMGRFFAPQTVGGLTESEKVRGRRVTTKFVAEALAGIRQCQPVVGNSVTLIKDLKLYKQGFILKGTAPLSATSKCFITPDPENP